ncbi:MAG: hypothetical protein M9958_05905 [Chitinophagales bacterium]|nr:hypothetical protein [Chitinophagales bacterium]
MENKLLPLTATLNLTKFICNVGILIGLYFFLYEGIVEPLFLPGHHFSNDDSFQLILGFILITISLFVQTFCEVVKAYIDMRIKL